MLPPLRTIDDIADIPDPIADKFHFRVGDYVKHLNNSPSGLDPLSLHDSLPIPWDPQAPPLVDYLGDFTGYLDQTLEDRKSTRLNSSHRCISYAVFCLKKKKYQVTKIC